MTKNQVEQVEEPKREKKVMSLKSVPISLKKIRKIIDDLKERDSSITGAEKFDLEISASYLRYLKDAVTGILEDLE